MKKLVNLDQRNTNKEIVCIKNYEPFLFIFSFTNIFEFLFEFNWIELRVIIIGIYILKRKKIRILLFMMILCCDPFITYLHFLHILYIKILFIISKKSN